ncbi:MAG TPA: MauE/DoxX family redox-associated membrane protein, partial [Puia sp.]|nr:MauE/DoxX family redox-associated membrane protein [Puia sp.]
MIKTIAPPLLILLFMYAAVSKLSDIAAFRAQLYRQPFPHGFADLLLFALPAAELLVVLMLYYPHTRLTGLKASLVLLLAFT